MVTAPNGREDRSVDGVRGGSARPSAATGASSPRTVLKDETRRREFTDAFAAGLELAAEMAAADETDPADLHIWHYALDALEGFASRLPPPLVNPLQLGGVSVEWHDAGLNIELRFRGVGDTFAVIEDALGVLGTSQGRDPQLLLTIPALKALIERTT